MATERLSVSDAARRLGIKDESVRKRLLRNTLTWDKDASGHVWVYLDTSDEYQDETTDTYQDQLLDQLRSENQYLREENQRKDSIIMSLSQRLPELPESAHSASDTSPGPVPFETEQSAPSSRQSRWQRLRRAWRVE